MREQGLLTAGWLVLAVAAVDLAGQLGPRLDLTRDGRFGLSDVSLDTVRALERPLVARVWFTEGLEAPYHEHRQALLDLLSELAAASGGRLRVDVTDPTGDPALVEEAARFGVRPLQYAFRSWDRTERRAVFLGVSFVYGDRQVAVEALPSIGRMELDVVGAIRSVTTEPDDRPAIGWWVGHGEPEPRPGGTDPLGLLASKLAERGSFRTVPSGDRAIPADLDLLLVVAPRSPVPTVDLLHLDQFLMGGGSVLVFAASVVPELDRLALREADHGLRPWLGQAGVVLGPEVLLDRDDNEQLALPAMVGGRPQSVQVNHPLVLVTDALDRSSPVTRDLPSLVLPFASPVSLADPLPPGVVGEVWASTDTSSAARSDVRSLDPRAVAEVGPGESPGPFPVIVALSGRFPSLFAERELPGRLDPEAPPFDRAQLVLESEPTRLVVVGSADAVANDAALTSNAVDWLLEDEALIGIRTKGDGDPPLRAPTRAAALQAKVLMTGAPLLVLGAGLLVVSLRRRSG